MFRRLDRRWRQATTLADLGNLTADWLEGRLPGEHPGGYDRPDDETLPLIPVLAQLNRAGYVTDVSQPGFDGPGYRNQRLEQRAAVEGWIEDGPVLYRILDAAKAAGLVVTQQGDGVIIGQESVPVTRLGGRNFTWFGRRLTDGDLRRSLRGLHREAYWALEGATHLTIADPHFGPHDRLWRVLDEAVR